MVGVLQYLTMTRPNISYALNLFSWFMDTTHLFVMQWIFHCLHDSANYGLTLKQAKNLYVILAYLDFD